LPKYLRDPKRLEAAIGRLRYSIRVCPYAIIPIFGAICATLLWIFGPGGLIVGLLIGFVTGSYASMIFASIIEWMMLSLVYLDDSVAPNFSNGIIASESPKHPC
jgi:hypothetical protein